MGGRPSRQQRLVRVRDSSRSCGNWLNCRRCSHLRCGMVRTESRGGRSGRDCLSACCGRNLGAACRRVVCPVSGSRPEYLRACRGAGAPATDSWQWLAQIVGVATLPRFYIAPDIWHKLAAQPDIPLPGIHRGRAPRPGSSRTGSRCVPRVRHAHRGFYSPIATASRSFGTSG